MAEVHSEGESATIYKHPYAPFVSSFLWVLSTQNVAKKA